MNDARILELAAQAKLSSVINGKVDAYYAPPDRIIEFADLIINELITICENIRDDFANSRHENKYELSTGADDCVTAICNWR